MQISQLPTTAILQLETVANTHNTGEWKPPSLLCEGEKRYFCPCWGSNLGCIACNLSLY